MNAWLSTTLGEVLADRGYIRGPFGSALKRNELKESGIPVYEQKNAIEGSRSFRFFVDDEKFEELRRFQVRADDLIISCSGTVGKISVIRDDDPKGIISQALLILRPNIEKADLRYLYHFLSSRQGFDLLTQASHGSVQVNIAERKVVESIPIILPPLEEQKAVSAILDAIGNKIDLLHRQNKTLEAMAETLFRQWFVEEADGWEMGVLGDAVDFFDGQRIPLSKMERDKRKVGKLYPYYGAAQVMDYVNEYIFDGDYILVGEDGTVRTDDGYPVLQFATGKFWVNNHAHVLKARPPYSNFFVWNYLSRKNIDDIVTGAVQPKINQGNLKALGFPRYPEALVTEFNSVTAPMLAKIQHNKTQIAGLEYFRDTLLPKLMSGEVRVRYNSGAA